ncbi:MAG: YbaB/EbfC family nucleoid-associated protein, partial [Actinomycetota bacterium]|nr:YbaB/EbfC family nucleoid-associated protein [Actinomycetota bacterium]
MTRTRYADKPREEWITVPVPEAGVSGELVDRARAALKGNEKSSRAGRRCWELSGGIFRCAECGRALVATTTLKGLKNHRRRMFYYQCATRRQVGKHACSFSRSINAKKAEVAVWDAISALLTDLESLRGDLEAMIEREKETRGDPATEAKAWAATLSEVERKRDKYQEMFTTNAMTLDELRSKLNALEERRETAQRELATLASWSESLEAFQRDKDKLLESYARPRGPRRLEPPGTPRGILHAWTLRRGAARQELEGPRRVRRGEPGLGKRKNVNKMMQQVQQMQQEMQQAQEELARETVIASAGGGAVKATMTGNLELVELQIDPEVLDPEDVEMLQD